MDKFDETPDAAELAQNTNLDAAEVQSLLFVEPKTTLMPFTWREYKVTRCGFPLTHAMVRTSTACQGKTCTATATASATTPAAATPTTTTATATTTTTTTNTTNY